MNTTEQHELPLPGPGPGTRRSIRYFRLGERGARPRVYIQTALHADEFPGMLVVHHLLRKLAGCRVTGELIIVPVANPIGMAQRVGERIAGRFDFVNGKNYNRHYPDLFDAVADKVATQLGSDPEENVALIRAALADAATELPARTESEALRATLLKLSVEADVCLDLHCDDDSILYLYSGLTHRDTVNDLAAQLGCELAILARESGGEPFDEGNSEIWSRLAERFPEHPVPPSCMASTLELRGSGDVSDELAEQDAGGILRFLINLGAVDGEVRISPDPGCPVYPIEGVFHPVSPIAGILVHKRRYGEFVRRGDVIAVVVDPLEPGEGARHEITSDIDGLIYALCAHRLVAPGQSVASISGATPLADRVGTQLLSD